MDEAVSSQIAARINAALIKEEEVAELLAQRKALILKKYTSGIDVLEAYKLEYVRWALDRIDDARHGAEIDLLEAKVDMMKKLIPELNSFKAELEANRAKSDKNGATSRR